MARARDDLVSAERQVWEHVGVTPTERRISLRTGEAVRVQEVGDGPPFVLLHGVSVAGTSWATLAAALQDVRCILVDRPGCGSSEPIVGAPLRDQAAVEAYADRLLGDLLDALGLDVAAVGATSLGGYFAFRGAAATPERVSRIVEYSWPVGAPVETAPFAARMAAVPGMRTVMAKMPMSRSMVRRALRQFGLGRAIDAGTFDDSMLDWVHALLNTTDTLANDAASSPRVVTPIRGENPEVLFGEDVLAALTMPVLLLWGALDPNGGSGVARTFAPRLPDAQLVIVDGAEHAPWFDDLSLCVERTRAFLLD